MPDARHSLLALAAAVTLLVGCGDEPAEPAAVTAADAEADAMHFNVDPALLADPVALDVPGGRLEVRPPRGWARLPAAQGPPGETIANWLSADAAAMRVAIVDAVEPEPVDAPRSEAFIGPELPVTRPETRPVTRRADAADAADASARTTRFLLNGTLVEQVLTLGDERHSFAIRFPVNRGRAALVEVEVPRKTYVAKIPLIESVLGSLEFDDSSEEAAE